MSSKDIFAIFKTMFPSYAQDAEMWYPNGKASIRIRMKNRSERIFTYLYDKEWRFETAKIYLKNK